MTQVTKRTVLGILGLAATPAAAHEFARPLQGLRPDTSHSFAIARGADFAAVLRRMADDIEAGGTHPQAVTVTSKTSIEDFVTHTISIDFFINESAKTS